MKKIILGILLAISTCTLAQKNQPQVTIYEEVMGYNIQNQSDIKGTKYVFSNLIHEWFWDAIHGIFTAQLRGLSKNGKWMDNNGHIVQYDLNNEQILWTKKMAYQTSWLQQFDNTMILSNANRSYSLDINTGKELRKIKNQIYHVNPVERIGLGYKHSVMNEYSNELEGIDLNTGEVLWSIDLIDREYGWNDSFYINDSTFIVVASGLHSINIKNGEGWDYNTVTGQKDYSGTIAKNAIGIGLGLLTGTFVISTGHDLVRDVVSNVSEDDSYFYLSSKEQIAKIDKQKGNVIWEQAFPKNHASKSSIFIEDDLLFMINKGYAYMGERQLDFGKAFIAAFDKETGKQLFFSLIPVKKGPVLGFLSLENEILLVFENKLMKYSKETGDLILEKEFSEQNFGKLKYFIGNQTYIINDENRFVSLLQTDTTKVFVSTNQNKILVIDDQLNVTNTINDEDLNVYYLKANDYKFISKRNKTWITNQEGEKIAELNVSSKAFLMNNILYDVQKNTFVVIDLTEILQ